MKPLHNPVFITYRQQPVFGLFKTQAGESTQTHALFLKYACEEFN